MASSWSNEKVICAYFLQYKWSNKWFGKWKELLCSDSEIGMFQKTWFSSVGGRVLVVGFIVFTFFLHPFYVFWLYWSTKLYLYIIFTKECFLLLIIKRNQWPRRLHNFKIITFIPLKCHQGNKLFHKRSERQSEQLRIDHARTGAKASMSL